MLLAPTLLCPANSTVHSASWCCHLMSTRACPVHKTLCDRDLFWSHRRVKLQCKVVHMYRNCVHHKMCFTETPRLSTCHDDLVKKKKKKKKSECVHIGVQCDIMLILQFQHGTMVPSMSVIPDDMAESCWVEQRSRHKCWCGRCYRKPRYVQAWLSFTMCV